jgi:hypothetical protein
MPIGLIFPYVDIGTDSCASPVGGLIADKTVSAFAYAISDLSALEVPDRYLDPPSVSDLGVVFDKI